MGRPKLKTTTIRARFWPKVAKTDTCWLWTGATLNNGYGQIKVGGIAIYTHRASYALHFGAIPKGLVVMHICDVPACCNPAHLMLGTQEENIKDMLRKGRR